MQYSSYTYIYILHNSFLDFESFCQNWCFLERDNCIGDVNIEIEEIKL